MEISDASAVGAVVSLCAVVGSLGGIIYKTLSSAIAALEKRVSQTEAKADSCEKDREDLRQQITTLDRSISRCSAPVCPLRAK
jgi:chaperonin cofactor prefoldin